MIINCQQVVKHYASKVVLDNIDLQVRQGEFFGLVGMNGSGKSTLIKAILDLVGINSGNIAIHDISHRQVSSRENIAYRPDRFSPPAHILSAGKEPIQQIVTGTDPVKHRLNFLAVPFIGHRWASISGS